MDEINENCPGVKIVLTALKCDLRKDEDGNENPNTIGFEQGLAKAKEIGAVKYLGAFFFPVGFFIFILADNKISLLLL